ncbi:DNA repair protein RAD52 homolog isoform X3 [Spodoptera litura]|uniref:DNA repair protein RAD52 homolog isoform X3 n=1 Tax=Spodoptera litura TaxID=69820 RepID=A0A9J7ECM5_SPOLT|nr:DNA repair protein RAD52 homolog isoform X3 [Spodoptera litura]
MQRKPGFPVANCSIKMPDNPMMPEHLLGEMRCDEDNEQQQKRQQLINFGHSQWGFNNWSWSVNKQELDFVDFTNGRYCAGVVAFVSITVKSFDIHRENIGYATTTANTKGFAIYKSRKCAVTNALRETLLSFGGSVASDLTELLESTRADAPANAPEPLNENNQNVANKQIEPKNMTLDRAARKDSSDSGTNHPTLRSPHASAVPPPVQNGPLVPPPAVKNAPSSARVLPTSMPPANRVPPVGPGRPAPGPAVPPPGPAPQPAHPRPNSNEPLKNGLEGLSEEEARAERKRRQRLAQEEFRQKQLMKQQGLDEKQELSRNSSSFDHLLMEIPTQDIMIEATGEEPGKRKSPGPDTSSAKRRNSSINKLDIIGN